MHQGNDQTAKILRARISDRPLPIEQARTAVDDAAAGAVVLFLGQVRNHDHGAQVSHLDYTAHPLADQIITEIANEFASRPGLHAIWMEHRIGKLQIGDAALVVAVSASHRKLAFTTTSEIVDEIKARIPIWKCQYFPDGSHEWSQCP